MTNDSPTTAPPPDPVSSLTGDAPAFAAAMSAIQKSLSDIELKKDKEANTGKYRYTYASLSSLLEAIIPAASERGVAFVQVPLVNKLCVGVRTIIAGETFTFTADTAFGISKIPAPQDAASFISYARRYAVLSIFGLAPDDDDGGERAQKSHQADREQQRKQQRERQDRARGAGAAPPDPQVILKAFAPFGIHEAAIVAVIERPLSKINADDASKLREILKRLGAGESIRDVLPAAALATLETETKAEDAPAEAPATDPPKDSYDELFGNEPSKDYD